jgi:head-tail adaptor
MAAQRASSTVDSGAYRHRVTIQNLVEVSDGHDGTNESWPDVHARWPARVRPLMGRDLELARQVDPRISHEVSFRYWAAYPTELDGGRARLVYHGLTDRLFEIVGAPIDVDERHVELVMTCKESV